MDVYKIGIVINEDSSTSIVFCSRFISVYIEKSIWWGFELVNADHAAGVKGLPQLFSIAYAYVVPLATTGFDVDAGKSMWWV